MSTGPRRCGPSGVGLAIRNFRSRGFRRPWRSRRFEEDAMTSGIPTPACPSCGTDHDPMQTSCPFRCPECGYSGDIDTFDCCGAEPDLICNRCNTQVEPTP